jgi:hypothetical protein
VLVDAQVLIGPALVGLYLKDGLLMLARDEGVLVRGWRGRWRAAFGPREWRLGGRAPYLCNPFKPQQPVLRLRWDATADPAAPAQVRADAPPALLSLGPWVGAIWLLLFVGLPLAFYLHMGVNVLLLLLAELYTVIAVTLVLVWRRRAALGLDARAFGMLAFEVLACAPYAANLVRRLSLMRRADEDLLVAARRLVPERALPDVLAACRRRIDDELEWQDETGLRAQALREARARLAPAGEAVAAVEEER